MGRDEPGRANPAAAKSQQFLSALDASRLDRSGNRAPSQSAMKLNIFSNKGVKKTGLAIQNINRFDPFLF